MKKNLIECLGCGERRIRFRRPAVVTPDECPRCGYVGWAFSSELDERTRCALRERPLVVRRALAS